MVGRSMIDRSGSSTARRRTDPTSRRYRPRMGDPLIDTLFRSTVQPTALPGVASAAPVRASGTRTRAGNAMDRTRTALLEGARRAVASNGTKVAMAQVAAEARVAKATLYNHFRTRDAVLAGLLAYEIETLCRESADRPLSERLTRVAESLSENPALRGIAALDPAVLARLATIDAGADGWRRAHRAVAAALSEAGLRGSDIVLRWIASYLLSPASQDAIAADVELLLTGLARAAADTSGGRNHPAASARAG
jgi:AcrR family transcriptional regulator